MASRLAIDGGSPVRTEPLPNWPAFGDEEVEAVERVLRSNRVNYWTGHEGRAFEVEYAESVGRAHGVAVANGTLALELALRAFGVGPGHEVIVPARTFIATASAAVAVGATPVIADVERDSGNLTADTVRDALSEHTRAIIPVHVGGWPVDMDPIVALANEHDLTVIEDCAQAHDGAYRGRSAGNLGSHAATFSFCQDKIIPVGDGGMLVLDDQDAYERAWAYKDHGKSHKKATESGSAPGGASFRWLVDSFGSNWRLDEMSSAVGRVGLRKLPLWHSARTENALRLAKRLSGATNALRVPLPAPDTTHAFYRLYAYVEPTSLREGWTRDRIIEAVNAEGIAVHYGVCAEVYREAAFEAASLGPSTRLPVAAELHETSLAFHVHPTLTNRDIDDTVAAVAKVMEAATT